MFNFDERFQTLLSKENISRRESGEKEVSQDELDKMKIKFDTDMVLNDVEGNSLTLKNGEKDGDKIVLSLPVQAQLARIKDVDQKLEQIASILR